MSLDFASSLLSVICFPEERWGVYGINVKVILGSLVNRALEFIWRKSTIGRYRSNCASWKHDTICFSTFQENLQKWLTDEKARDQFVIRAGSDTEVFWNDARHLKPEPVYKRPVRIL